MTISEQHDDLEIRARQRVDDLLQELEQYRLQSQRLQQINELYKRRAGIVDVPTMIETYSVWLMQYVSHELIGYRNIPKNRQHLYCSSHGPERRQIIDTAKNLLHQQKISPERQYHNGYYCHLWSLREKDPTNILVLLQQAKKMDDNDIDLVIDSLAVLQDPLERALEYEEIFEQARRDALTRLPNRLYFEERIGSLLERARRYGHPITLAALDLDRFKAINDTLGHLAGDHALKQVADTLKNQIRLNDLLVRIGGDEFLLVLPDTSIEAATSLNKRLCQAVDSLHISTGRGQLGISIGLAQWEPKMSLEQWMEKADDALYQAKANGRAQVAIAPGI